MTQPNPDPIDIELRQLITQFEAELAEAEKAAKMTLPMYLANYEAEVNAHPGVPADRLDSFADLVDIIGDAIDVGAREMTAEFEGENEADDLVTHGHTDSVALLMEGWEKKHIPSLDEVREYIADRVLCYLP